MLKVMVTITPLTLLHSILLHCVEFNSDQYYYTVCEYVCLCLRCVCAFYVSVSVSI
jgi:hypothetical protein